MATKTCPECGAEVPVSALRCKECFHDFQQEPSRSTGPLLILASFAAMSVVGALVFWGISMRPIEHRVLVDEATQAVIFTTQYRTGPVTDRLDWSEIVMLQHVVTGTGAQEIIAITIDGDRKVIQHSENKPLRPEADRYARVMNKPVTYIDSTTEFLDGD